MWYSPWGRGGRSLAAVAAGITVVTFFVDHGHAEVRRWASTTGGFYQNPASWDPAFNTPFPTFPSSLDEVLFDLNSTYTVNLIANASQTRMTVQHGDVTFNQSAERVFSVTQGDLFDPGLRIGTTAGFEATLRLTQGTITASTASVGFAPYLTGHLHITGGSSVFQTGDYLVIGQYGSGWLRADNGAVLNTHRVWMGMSNGSAGHAEIVGPNTQWNIATELMVGVDGTASMEVRQGAQVVSERGNLGFGDNSDGSVILRGTGTHWHSTLYTWVGHQGSGYLGVMDGASKKANDIVIGMLGTGEADVTGTGSQLEATSNLTIGAPGSQLGRLRVTDGGRVDANAVFLGENKQLNQLIVSGDGSQLHTSSTTIASYGLGELIISDGAVVDAGKLDLGYAAGHGLVRVDGPGTKLLATEVLIANAGRGELELVGGAFASFQQMAMGNSATAQANALITDADTLLQIDASLRIGHASGGEHTFIISNGATVDVGGELMLHEGSFLQLDGGTLNVGALTQEGQFELQRGTLTVGSDFHWMAHPLILHDDIQLIVDGTLSADHLIQLAGGTLSVKSLADSMPFGFDRGTLHIRDGGITVAADSALGAAFMMRDGMDLSADQNIHIASDGTLILVGGTLSSHQHVINEGELQLNGTNALIDAETLVNRARWTRGGRINANVLNDALGDIWLLPGDQLWIDGSMDNQGAINLTAARIDMLSGALMHAGIMNVWGFGSQSGSRIDGAVVIAEEGIINVAAGATLAFHDNVLHQGAMHVAQGGAIHFFGDVSGSGAFQQGGHIHFFGSLNPGNSPGTMMFEGDVTFDANHLLVMELGAAAFDHIDVDGLLTLGGTLRVVLLDGYVPMVGDAFDLLDWGSVQGTFDVLDLPTLSGSLAWNTDALLTTGTITVVPEPTTLTPFLLAAAAMLRRRPDA